MRKYAYILVSIFMVAAQLVTNFQFFAYTNTCNSSNKFEITLEKHICSLDCCGTSCNTKISDIKNCCSEEIHNIDDSESNCCESRTISIDNSLDLQQIIHNTTIKVNVTYTIINNNDFSTDSKSRELLRKDFASNLSPPLSSNILKLLKVLHISKEDDDYYC